MPGKSSEFREQELAAALPFHVRNRDGGQEEGCREICVRREENKDEGGGRSSGGKAVYIVVEAAIQRFTQFWVALNPVGQPQDTVSLHVWMWFE